MWGGMAGLVLQLIAGAVGGSVVGTVLKQFDLGILGNLLIGIIGGGIGAQLIGALLGGGEASRIVDRTGLISERWLPSLRPACLAGAHWY